MRGEKVTVISLVDSGQRDAGNAPIMTESQTDVENVLVAPGPRSDVIESNRPDGVNVVYSLYFPKTFIGSLRGTQIKVRGTKFHTIGDPQPYPDDLTPTPWNRPVEVEGRDG